MKVVSFYMENTGCFGTTKLLIAPTATHATNVTVITGTTGAGKSLLLKSLANAMSWYVARLRGDNNAGTVMPDMDVRTGKMIAKLETTVQVDGLQPDTPIMTHTSASDHITTPISITSPTDAAPVKDTFTWNLFKIMNAQAVGTSRVAVDELMTLIKTVRANLSADPLHSVPMIAYYPVERWVIDIPLLAKAAAPSDQLSCFDIPPPAAVNFLRFFEWFREQEDLENERRADAHRNFFNQNSATNHDELFGLYARLETTQRSVMSYQLDAVRNAIHQVLPELSNLRIERAPKLRLVIDKNGTTLSLSQLSQGERCLLTMVGDVARRLATQHPAMSNPLLGVGIVMIDEVALHLSPETQQVILQRLSTTFPNCQLIVTTLCPEVYRGVPDILCYELHHGAAHILNQAYRFNVHDFMRRSTDIAVLDHSEAVLAPAIIETAAESLLPVANSEHPEAWWQLLNLITLSQGEMSEHTKAQLLQLQLAQPSLHVVFAQLSEFLAQYSTNGVALPLLPVLQPKSAQD